MVRVPACLDETQSETKLQMPQIRVWCHPHKLRKTGDDFYFSFKTFEAAFKFIAKHKEADKTPVLAFRGLELNIFEMAEADVDGQKSK